jgi:hypothetical protein
MRKCASWNLEDVDRDSGFASKPAVADLDIKEPNSGKPEFGRAPGMTVA